MDNKLSCLSSTLSGLFIALGLVAGGYFINGGLHYMKDFHKSVEVKGLDERKVNADQAVWTLDYSYNADTAEQIYIGIEKVQQKVVQFLVEQGIDQKELEIQNVNVNENVSYGEQKTQRPKLSGRGSILVVTNKVDVVKSSSQKLGELLKQGVVLGQSRIVYNFTELNTIKTEMLANATKNAKEAAQSFAQHAGGKIGSIKNASQGFFSIENATEGTDYGVSTLQKKVRVVTQVEFFLL